MMAAPLVSDKRLIRSTFILSWGYVAADVIFEADKAKHIYGQTLGEVVRGAGERFTFQGLSSIVFPYLTLRAVVGGVKQRIGATAQSPAYLRYAPQAEGLAWIPAMPYIWDAPSRWIARTVFAAAFPEEE